MPRRFEPDLNAPLRGLMIFIRRTNHNGQVSLLGRRFQVSRDWMHRLVGCEVHFEHQRIRCFVLRRRAPDDQQLLATLYYQFPNKPFKGTK